ncbi:MAG: sigma-54 dependent transcriptional regulator [Acidobacteriota bacterium]|nr:sigma-54 dependent transcriptional regulator [Acidobacteriota bacterium]
MNPASPNPIECAAVTSSVRKCEGRGSDERRSPHAGVGGCCDTAHELANLVTAVLMNAHVLQWRMPSHSRMKRPVLEIERQAQRGGELLKYLLRQLESLQPRGNLVASPAATPPAKGARRFKIRAPACGQSIGQRPPWRLRFLVLPCRELNSHCHVTAALARFSQKGMMVVNTDAQFSPTPPPPGLATEEGMKDVLSADTILSDEPMCATNLLNLLIVDDERSVCESCREVAHGLGFAIQVADSAEQAYRALETCSADVVLLDLRLPANGGLEVLRQIKQCRPETLVVVMTGFATVQSAEQAMKLGAYDYITKPFDFDELQLVLQRAAAHLKITAENRLLREQVRAKHGFGLLVGHAPEMEKLYRIIAKAAHSTHPVLILGESGTGKELVARSIHYSGPWRDQLFIPVDCGSLVPTLIESELFGYVRGAFAGAVRAKDGLLATAEGGTVFLDEIGELPVDLQAKLLRAIQEKEVRPVGGTRAVPINVRILAATNRDLEEAVKQGTFRRDLYFRLNVLTLRVPSLRERKQDIPLLIGSVLDRINDAREAQHTLGDDALRLMLSYDWPGNVRELENCLERACTTCSLSTIHVNDLPTALRAFQHRLEPEPAAADPAAITPLDQLEKRAILHAIDVLHGDKLKAALQLGIGKTTLYRKLKEYGLQD